MKNKQIFGFNNNRKRIYFLYIAIPIMALLLFVASCASMATPDGGPYDEKPPVMLRSTPMLGALHSKEKRIVIEFDEYIKLEKAAEKVVISPPQIEMPEIKTSGKRVIVSLYDTLRSNTTYSIDFGDAIVDNNEGNPMGQFAFVFSTGDVIDSMAVSGTVLDASNLEPIKGIQVGLYSDLSDSAFVTKPFERVSRTDGSGRFSIRGVAPGEYRIYGLMDSDQDFIFSQKNEMIAFFDSIIVPDYKFAVRQDTLWIDSLTIDTIIDVSYTRFLPDDLILLAFKEELDNQYLIKSERLVPNKFSFYFATKTDSIPAEIEGLNFDAKDAFMIQHSLNNDTLHYWVKDSLVYNLDTLEMTVSYLYTDTLNMLVPRVDTLYMSSRKTRAMIQKEEAKAMEEFQKELKKRRKRDSELTDTLPPTKFLNLKVSPTGTTDVNRVLTFEFNEPLLSYDINAIHVRHKVDTLWNDIPYVFEPIEGQLLKYRLLAEWRPEQEYELEIDSIAFIGLYGLHTNKLKQNLKMRSLDDYGTITFDVKGRDLAKGAFVELLNTQDIAVNKVKVENGRAEFFFITPGKYYARLVNDQNENELWDTGLYVEKLQAEKVYYYPQALEVRALWDMRQDWNLDATPLNMQKPLDITKQKPDTEKQSRNKNAERKNKK